MIQGGGGARPGDRLRRAALAASGGGALWFLRVSGEMILRSVVRDCLYLNWALRRDALPAPPQPLRYECHLWQGEQWVFASALLFRQEGLRLRAFPFARISYPQFNLRLYALDDEGVPSVLFWSVLVPAWVVPGARALARQSAQRGRFRYPFPSRDASPWRWRVQRRTRLTVSAQQASPEVGEGPTLGSWEATVAALGHRLRGYALGRSGLQRVEATRPRAAVWPVKAEVEDARLLASCLPLGDGAPWPPLHSAWLCPEIPFVFELAGAREHSLPRQVPATG